MSNEVKPHVLALIHCGFRITFGPIRPWNLAVNHGGRSSTVKLTHHNRFDHKPQIPSRPLHTRKLLHIQKYGQGLTVILSICCSHNSVSIELVTVLAWRTWSYILFKVSALILRVVERTQMRIWSQNIYILRLFKTSQAGSLRTELYQNGHRTSKKLQNWFGLFFLFWFACWEMLVCVCVWWWECLVIVLRAKCALTNIVKPGSSYVLIKL